MTSPHRSASLSVVWLFATLVLASCASRPPVRDVEESVRELRSEYLHANPNGEFNRSIERGEVALGMRFEDVVASWGIPDSRERSGDGVRERWSYTVSDDFSRDWVRYDLVFEKKALASWESMRNVSSSHPLTGAQSAPVPPQPSAGGAGVGGSGVARR